MLKRRSLALLVASIVVTLGLLAAPHPLFAASSEHVIYSFCKLAGCPDGYSPQGSPIVDARGNLYGVTNMGGRHGDGTAFELTLSHGKWKEMVLHSFNRNGNDGAFPAGGLVLDKAGNLYGTTSCYVYKCGRYGYGNVFELTPGKHGRWTEKVLHSFTGRDGGYPYGLLALDETGTLYGTTLGGGAYSQGAVFELRPNNGKWTERVLHSFNPNGYDGCEPYAGLIFDTSGNLYGATSNGGTGTECGQSGCGTVFELTRNNGQWTEDVLYSFGQSAGDGAQPNDLIFDGTGHLYGTTSGGGISGYGTVFDLAPNSGNWTEAVLHEFSRKDGAYPQSRLIFDTAGNLYGTTHEGGVDLSGVVFELMLKNGTWIERAAHRFGRGRDAKQPSGPLVFDAAGNLLGMSFGGGESGNGTVFEFTP